MSEQKPASECTIEECCDFIESQIPESDESVVAAVGDCPCSFPKSVPFDCIKELLAMARGGETLNIAKGAVHAACVIGSVGALLGGTDDNETVFATVAEAQAADAIPPWLLPLLPYVFEILQKWLSR